MTYESILSWIDGVVKGDDWESQTTLAESIAASGSDITGKIEDWVLKKGHTSEGASFFSEEFEPRFESVSGGIISREEEAEQIQEDVQEIKEKIPDAKTQDDIAKIIPSRTQLRTDIGKEQAQELIDLLEEKADELLSASQEVFVNVGGQIELAETNEGLDEILGGLEDIENLTNDDRSALKDLIEDKRL